MELTNLSSGNMKILKKKKYPNGRRKIYFLGFKIFSYKKRYTKNMLFHILENIVKQNQCLQEQINNILKYQEYFNSLNNFIKHNEKIQADLKNKFEESKKYNQKILQSTCFIWQYLTGLEFCNYKTLKHEREISFSPELYAKDHYYRYKFAADLCTDTSDVLDIACGTGCGGYILSQKAQSVTCVDLSQEAINFAQKIFLPKASNIIYQQGNALTYNAGGKLFDIIVSFETIEHISATKELLYNYRSLLKDGGILICSVPNENVYPFVSASNPHHVRHYTPDELAELVRSAGFVPEKLFFQYDYGVVEAPKDDKSEGNCIVLIAKKII